MTGRVKNAGMAAMSTDSGLKAWEYTIREPEEGEVLVRVLYCGICHSDIHMSRSEWYPVTYPMVPGHEFIGVVDRLGPSGSESPKFKVGDHVGIGCMVSSCKKCDQCERGEEQYCTGMVLTYDGRYKDENTYGGYGRYVVVRSDFAVRVPDALDITRAAPLLCAGITTYSPLKANQVERGGLRIAVVGLGGLGHMGVQFAAKLNPTNEVYVLTRTAKKAEAAKKLGAKDIILSTDPAQMSAHQGFFDYLLDTVSSPKNFTDLLGLLKPRGSLITVGLPGHTATLPVDVQRMATCARSLQGSCIGGIRETQEMLDFCAEHDIHPIVEHVSCDKVNEAYQRVLDSDVTFRFVLTVGETAPKIE